MESKWHLSQARQKYLLERSSNWRVVQGKQDNHFESTCDEFMKNRPSEMRTGNLHSSSLFSTGKSGT